MVVARHSQNHIEKPAKAIITAANKGKDARSEREQLVVATEQGDMAVKSPGWRLPRVAQLTEDLKKGL